MELAAAWRSYLDAARRDWNRFLSWPRDESAHFTQCGRWERLSVQTRSHWVSDEVYEHGNWTAGFMIGTGALLHGATPDTEFERGLRARITPLAERAGDTTTHDLGFLFHPSFVVAHALGLLDVDEAAPAHHAARTLARRYNAGGRFIQAFGPIGDDRSAGTSTVDTMMNLPLLWWASRAGGDRRLHVIAHQHAQTTARVFVRSDGSTYHLAKYDPLDGSVRWRGTFQGAGSASCWSRGQAWVICGGAWAFAATGDPELLKMAERTADYYWERLPDDGVPPWDFADTAPGAQGDASASAITALGALILGRAHPDSSARERYTALAEQLLGRLVESSINTDPETEGILLRSCYSLPHDRGVDGAMAWGDFYLGLALGVATGAVDLAAVGCPAAPTTGEAIEL